MSIFIILLIISPQIAGYEILSTNYVIILQIFMFMLVSQGLELSGFFNKISQLMINKLKNKSVFVQFLILALISGLFASVIMNDSAIFVFLPFIATYLKNIKKQYDNINQNYILFLIISIINIGSSLTPMGNPQNIIIWHYYDIDFWNFILYIMPFISITFIFLLLTSIFFLKIDNAKKFKIEMNSKAKQNNIQEIKSKKLKSELSKPKIMGSSLNSLSPPVPISIRLDKKVFYISALLLIIDIILVECNFTIIAFLITFGLFLLIKRTMIIKMDYILLLIFLFMFIDINILICLVQNFLNTIKDNISLTSEETFLFAALLSQIISNVPATIVLKNFTNAWLALAVGANIGGLGFIIGSMANLIAVRLINLNIKKFLIYSIPFFLLNLIFIGIIFIFI
ncbi:MAG: SLC13 family permease [Candidatus Helarchaeota archaeon]